MQDDDGWSVIASVLCTGSAGGHGCIPEGCS